MKSAFGSERLADLDRARLQQFLDGLALEYCHDTVHLAHTYLRAIFRLAVDEGWLPKNVARTLTIPKTTRDRDETILSLESVQQFEDELDGSDRIIWQLCLAAVCAQGRCSDSNGRIWHQIRHSAYSESTPAEK
jgi:site-specific recombinase XerD